MPTHEAPTARHHRRIWVTAIVTAFVAAGLVVAVTLPTGDHEPRRPAAGHEVSPAVGVPQKASPPYSSGRFHSAPPSRRHAVINATTSSVCPPGWKVCPTEFINDPSLSTKVHCVSSPDACGFADETNTGILANVRLTKVPSQATSGPGWKCSPSPSNCQGIAITGNVGSETSGLELADGLEAFVPNGVKDIMIRNFKLDGVHGQSDDGILVSPSTTGVTIDHCDLTGASDGTGPYSSARGWVGIHIKNGASDYAVQYCNIRGFAAGIFPEQESGTDRFIGNFIHHMTCWDYIHKTSCDNPTSNGSTIDHCNDFGNGGGPADLVSTQLIEGNTFWADNPVCMSTAIALFPDGNRQTNQHTIIDHNLLSGAGYCVNPGYEDAYGSYGRSYVVMLDNHWSTWLSASPNCGSFGISYVYPLDEVSGNGNLQCGNVWDDGPLAGSGADKSNEYPKSRQPVSRCSF